MDKDPLDPKGLIRESYRIEGITPEECRSIFLDWALSLSGDSVAAIKELLARYQPAFPDHPMTAVLTEGTQTMTRQGRRRGGWRSRQRN